MLPEGGTGSGAGVEARVFKGFDIWRCLVGCVSRPSPGAPCECRRIAVRAPHIRASAVENIFVTIYYRSEVC